MWHSITSLNDTVREYCVSLRRAFHCTEDAETLSQTVYSMIVESTQFRTALDQFLEAPSANDFYRLALEEAVEAAIGSYFRYLEQKGRCSDADRVARELAAAISAEAEAGRPLRSPG